VQATINTLLASKGSRTAVDFHRHLGQILWDYVGMARNDAGLRKAIAEIATLRSEFWADVRLTGESNNLNQDLERAGRVADWLEFGELLAQDALHRTESCGGHFREESQTPEGEAKRDDEHFSYVAAWEFQGVGKPEILNKEPLEFEEVHLTQRSYK
jgi:succinate dehydrogenase flavoprotein subunit